MAQAMPCQHKFGCIQRSSGHADLIPHGEGRRGGLHLYHHRCVSYRSATQSAADVRGPDVRRYVIGNLRWCKPHAVFNLPITDARRKLQRKQVAGRSASTMRNMVRCRHVHLRCMVGLVTASLQSNKTMLKLCAVQAGVGDVTAAAPSARLGDPVLLRQLTASASASAVLDILLQQAGPQASCDGHPVIPEVCCAGFSLDPAMVRPFLDAGHIWCIPEGSTATPIGSDGPWKRCAGAVPLQGNVQGSPARSRAEHIPVRGCRRCCLAVCLVGHRGPDGDSACLLDLALKRKNWCLWMAPHVSHAGLLQSAAPWLRR